MEAVAVISQWLTTLAQHQGYPALFAILLLAAVIEARGRKIPAWLTSAGLVIAFALATSGGDMDYLLGQMLGMLLGLGLMLPLYAMGTAGAGEVKLVALCGAFLGPRDLVPAMLATFAYGGAMALGLAIPRKAAHALLARAGAIATSLLPSLPPPSRRAARPARPAPRALWVAMGTCGFLILRQGGML